MSVRLSYADCDGNGTINPATEILEENNYYPFGLQHQGYNDIANSCRNEEAEAYKYNGKEYEDSFGLNIYEMDMRQLDPAIGRWLVQDPVVHHDYSPYSAFDNNPVYWSDPSGADATSLINSLWNRSGSGLTSYTLEDGEVIDVQYDTAESLQSMYELTANTGDTGGGGGDGKKDTRTKAQKEADTRAHLQAMLKINKSLLDIRILMTPIEELQALYISLKALAKNGTKNIGDLYAKVEIYLTKTLASKSSPSLVTNTAFNVNPNKYNYFFGRVTTGSTHNIERSTLNLKNLTSMGITTESQLSKIFAKALDDGTYISTKSSEFGTTVTKSISIGDKGSIHVGFFYQSGNMNSIPSVSTIIPKAAK